MRRPARRGRMITYGTNPGMVIPIGGRIPQRYGDADQPGDSLKGAHARSAYQAVSP